MFAMLNGGWPRVAADGTDLAALEADAAAGTDGADGRLAAAVAALVEEVVRAQEAAGFDLVTDGSVRWADAGEAVLRALADDDTGPAGLLVRTWRSTAALTERVAAQVVPGPFSLARRVKAGRPADVIAAFTREMADHLGDELRALADAGCPLVAVEEPDVVAIGAGDEARDLFLDSQQRLLAPAPGLHAMLVIDGGSAEDAGAEAIFGAPYRSFLFDLVAGPDNWRLVRAAPGDRGIVCGALRPDSPSDQSPELVWAARYAASSNGRGPERVGLTTAGSLASLSPDAARRALDALATAVRLAGMPLEAAIEAGLDPRTIALPSDPPVRRARRGA